MSIVTLTDGLPAILARIRRMETNHAPDGRPEVQMRDLTAMRDEIMHLLAALEQAWSALDDLKEQPKAQPTAWHSGGFYAATRDRLPRCLQDDAEPLYAQPPQEPYDFNVRSQTRVAPPRPR